MRHKFPSIKDKGGLKVHLNETADSHRGLGYKMYRLSRTAGLNVTARSKLFNVVFDTMKEWDVIDDKEREEKRLKAEADIEDLKNV